MKMNRILAVGASLLLGIGLAGCGNNTIKNSSNSQEVSGPLRKVGTYTKDSDTGKTTLLAIKNYHNKNVKTKAATYYFKEAKLLKIETTKKSQRVNDENNFGKSSLILIMNTSRITHLKIIVKNAFLQTELN